MSPETLILMGNLYLTALPARLTAFHQPTFFRVRCSPRRRAGLADQDAPAGYFVANNAFRMLDQPKRDDSVCLVVRN
jgi:hypothetical protein